MKVLLSSDSKIRFSRICKISFLTLVMLGMLPGQAFAQVTSCNETLGVAVGFPGVPIFIDDQVPVLVAIRADEIDGGGPNPHLDISNFQFGPDCSEFQNLDTCTNAGNDIELFDNNVDPAITTTCVAEDGVTPIEFTYSLGPDLITFIPNVDDNGSLVPEAVHLNGTPVGYDPETDPEITGRSCLIAFNVVPKLVELNPPSDLVDPGKIREVFGWNAIDGNCNNEDFADASSGFSFTVAIPQVAVEKYTNGPGQTPEDADVAPGPSILAGDVVTWTYAVENIGNVDLSNVLVTDSLTFNQVAYDACVDDATLARCGDADSGVVITCPGGGNTISLLIPGQTVECTATGTATPGQYENFGDVAGTYEGVTVYDVDPSHYLGDNPDFTIEKTSPQYPGPLDAPGTITYDYLVSNTGNVDLTNLVLFDTNTVSAPTCGSTTLIVGAFTTCTATHEFTEQELEFGGNAACGLYNHVTANTDQVGPREDDLCIPVIPPEYASIPILTNLGLLLMASLLLLTGLITRRLY